VKRQGAHTTTPASEKATVQPASTHGFDALLPPEMAARAEEVGAKKTSGPWAVALVLGVIGGAFIALGAAFSLVVAAGGAGVPYGLHRLLVGLAFSLGLVMVVVAGAELFTGNSLLVMAWLGRRISLGSLLRNWGIVYVGNLLGACGIAGLLVYAGFLRAGGGQVAAALVESARAKLTLGFVQAIALGVLCNLLVCLAVWMSYSARSTVDRIASVVGPVAAFAAAGFEHSVANMFTLPLALMAGRSGAPGGLAATVTDVLLVNLLPVTLGNILGGGVCVGAVYWFVYARSSISSSTSRDG
jgi:formate/nitrite transporter